MSIGRLFAAGIVPGLLMMVVLMMAVRITAKNVAIYRKEPNERALVRLEELRSKVSGH